MKKQEINKKKSFKKTMTSKALEANRKNARKSTGPKTQRSKSLIISNLKHGVFASIPVLPVLESRKEYDKLVKELKKDLCPRGVLEEELVIKIANIIWKTRRLVNYENICLLKKYADVCVENKFGWVPWNKRILVVDKHPGPKFLAEMFESLTGDSKNADKNRSSFLCYAFLPDDYLFDGPNVLNIINSICDYEYLERKRNKLDVPDSPSALFDLKDIWPDILEENFSTTKKQLKEVILIMANEFGKTYDELVTGAGKMTYSFAAECNKTIEEYIEKIHHQATGKLFDEDPAERIMKFEAHLNRQLLQTLHELQRIQGMRVGISRPPEAIDITSEGV